MIKFKGNDDIAHSYLITRFDRCMLIDPANNLEEITKAIENKKLDGILITHAHSDHVNLIDSFDVPIYIHKNDSSLLFMDEHNGYYPNKHPYKKENLNLVFIEDDQKIPFADSYITCVHTPGHTSGSVSYLYENKLFCGDTLFKESVGRHDLFSGSFTDLKRSVIRLLTLDANIKVYPGHDLETTIRHEQKTNPFYLKWKKQYKR